MAPDLPEFSWLPLFAPHLREFFSIHFEPLAPFLFFSPDLFIYFFDFFLIWGVLQGLSLNIDNDLHWIVSKISVSVQICIQMQVYNVLQ